MASIASSTFSSIDGCKSFLYVKKKARYESDVVVGAHRLVDDLMATSKARRDDVGRWIVDVEEQQLK